MDLDISDSYKITKKVYKNSLLKSGQIDQWRRTGLFLCNYLQVNENPIPLRTSLKERIIDKLNHTDDQTEFQFLIEALKKCDEAQDLFD